MFDNTVTLKDLVREKDSNFTEVADFVGVSAATVSAWGTGKTQIREKYVRLLASFFDVPNSVIRTLKPEPPSSCIEFRVLNVMGEWRSIAECESLPHAAVRAMIRRRLNIGFSDEEAVFPPRTSAGPYPENERIQQYVEWEGKKINLVLWARREDIPLHRLYARLGYGWTIEDTLNIPFEKHQSFEYKREYRKREKEVYSVNFQKQNVI